MKKILLATTLLAASAGFAAAEVKVSGEAFYRLANDGTKTTDSYKTSFTFTGTGTSDGGVEFGGSLTLMNDGNVDGPGSFFISGAFGKLSFNDVDGADAAVGIGMADVGFDGIGVDDDAEGGKRRNASASQLLYTNTIGNISFAVSSHDAKTGGSDSSVGVKYTSGDFYGAAAYSKVGADNVAALTVGGKAGAAAFNVFYAKSDKNGAGYGADVTYTVSPVLSVTAAVGGTDTAGDKTDFGVGASYDLGGGLSVGGGIGSVDGKTHSDFGVKMKF